MLHRIVSRSVVALAATAFLASCEDNTTGTPLPPPPASTAVDVTPVEPAAGYGFAELAVTLPNGTDTTVTVVSPSPVFHVAFPDGELAAGQTINFSLTLPGLLESTSATVGSDGFVSPGYWAVGDRPVQRIIASPASGNPGIIDVDTTEPEE
jgi:hypothetical protein